MPIVLKSDEIKRTLQRHLTPGIVVVVGSGLSCAEGLPSMTLLGDHLETADLKQAKVRIDPTLWDSILVGIKKDGIEAALKKASVPEEVADFLRVEIAGCVLKYERSTIQEVLTQGRALRFSKLLPHLPNSDRFVVITTNYDRLLELATEAAGFLVDTRARGSYFAPFTKTGGAFAFVKNVIPLKGGMRKIEEKCLSLYKPHGSLDWIVANGQTIRTGFDLGLDRALIVTPGRDKYRAGYDQPFDMHRELANDAITRATRLLIIGYGFNDDHLETHLSKRIKAGTPTVIMSKTLTSNARNFLLAGSSVWALEEDPTSGGTIVHNGITNVSLSGEQLWDVGGFVQGVMGG